METGERPLRVLIAGAGIAGLTAAVGLRQQGHEVILFERSELAQETAAAIHLAPNCHVILRRFGIKPEKFGANPVNGFLEHDKNGKVRLDLDLRQALKIWEQPWMLVHRARLHDELKRVATQEGAPGVPAIIHTSSKVIDVDCSNATIKLLNGGSVKGDVVIGADGVGSATRVAVAGPDVRPFGSGKSAFRFLVPFTKIRGNPETEHFLRRDGFMTLWYGDDRRLVMYPCENNTIMNFVAIHPTRLTKGSVTGGWNATASKQLLLDVYNEFGSIVASLLNLVDEKDLKIWELLDMSQLSTWTNDRTVLIGDAAHPFLPHQGQGGGIAMEDAASLSALLRPDTRREDIPELLKLYENIRRDRAHKVQDLTRIAGRDLDETTHEKFAILEFTNYNYSHDEYSNSTHILDKWLWSRHRDARWTSPVSFGPIMTPDCPSIEQTAPLDRRSMEYALSFKSSATYLKTLFPTESFSFVSAGTVANVTLKYRETLTSDHFGPRTKRTLSLHLHHVQFRQADGTTVVGSFLPVYFTAGDESEEEAVHLGLPKVQCSLESRRVGNNFHVIGNWRGNTFLRLNLSGFNAITSKQQIKPSPDDNTVAHPFGTVKFNASGATIGGKRIGEKATLATGELNHPEEIGNNVLMNKGPDNDTAAKLTNNVDGHVHGPPRGPPKIPDEMGMFWYNYVPRVGQPDKADAAYTVFAPFDGSEKQEALEEGSIGDIQWFQGDWKSLPSMHHIVKGLAQIPMYSITKVSLAAAKGADNLLHAKKLE